MSDRPWFSDLWTYAEYQAYLLTDAWKAVRRIALDHAGCSCDECGALRQLHVHHLHYQTLGRETLRDVQVLCADCHGRAHRVNPALRPPSWERGGWSMTLLRKGGR